MKNKQLRLAAFALVIWGMILIIISARKEVALTVNGETRLINTYAWTVRGALRAANLPLDPRDHIKPDPSRWLQDGQQVELLQARPVSVLADGRRLETITPALKPANILQETGIALYPGDKILVNGQVIPSDQHAEPGKQLLLQVQRATPVTLTIGDQVLRFTSSADTVAGALSQQQVPVYLADRLNPPLETPLRGKPLEIELKRSRPLEINLGDQVLATRSAADRVGEALVEAGITLQGLDYSQPADDQPLPEDGPIQVVRVEEEIILNQEAIPFTSQFQATNELPLDQQQILDGGSYGLRAQQIRVIYENGEERSREVEREWVVKEPEPRIVGYGTDIQIKTVDTPDGPIRVWREITAYATSYNSSCPGCDSITSSGAVLKKGIIAVTLEWYRYMQGLQVYIPGYGFGRIEDVGAGIPGKYWVDLGYKKENYVPWSQNVTVYFIAPPPPPENIMYVLY